MATDTRPKRLLVAVILSTLFASGVLIASGVSQILAAELLPLDPSGAGPLAAAGTAATTKRYDPNPLLRRNIFDSVTGDLTRVEGDATEEPTEEPIEPSGELDLTATYPTCSGSSRLVGAFVIRNRPEDSFAVITDATGSALLFQEGMNVSSRPIAAIRPQSVVFQDGGHYCQLGMLTDEEQVATAPTAVAAAPSVRAAVAAEAQESGSGGISNEELDANISRISDTQYSVNRSLVDRLISNQAALMRTARVIPHEEGGQVVGVKLYGIRRSSLLGRLGVQNGDMVRTINGFDMTSPDTALQAYARLREADRITINLVRRGQPMTMDYQIR